MVEREIHNNREEISTSTINSEAPDMIFHIGGLHRRHVGGKNKRNFAHIVCIKMEVNSKRIKLLLFHTTNMLYCN